MRITGASCQGLSLIEEFRDALLRIGAATRRGLADFKRHCARDARNLTGAQRQQEMQTLEIGAANQIDYAQTRRDGPANVDAQEIGFRNHFRGPFGEPQAPQLNK